MSTTHVIATPDPAALADDRLATERWNLWTQRGRDRDARTGRRLAIVATVIVVGLVGVLGRALLGLS
jgi:hypothetical protein